MMRGRIGKRVDLKLKSDLDHVQGGDAEAIFAIISLPVPNFLDPIF